MKLNHLRPYNGIPVGQPGPGYNLHPIDLHGDMHNAHYVTISGINNMVCYVGAALAYPCVDGMLTTDTIISEESDQLKKNAMSKAAAIEDQALLDVMSKLSNAAGLDTDSDMVVLIEGVVSEADDLSKAIDVDAQVAVNDVNVKVIAVAVNNAAMAIAIMQDGMIAKAHRAASIKKVAVFDFEDLIDFDLGKDNGDKNIGKDFDKGDNKGDKFGVDSLEIGVVASSSGGVAAVSVAVGTLSITRCKCCVRVDLNVLLQLVLDGWRGSIQHYYNPNNPKIAFYNRRCNYN